MLALRRACVRVEEYWMRGKGLDAQCFVADKTGLRCLVKFGDIVEVLRAFRRRRVGGY